VEERENFFIADPHGALIGILSDYVKPLDIIKELVSNSVDHGKAKMIEITLKKEILDNRGEGLTLIYEEKAKGMNKIQQKRWHEGLLKREYEGTGEDSIEKHKGRGSKGVLNSNDFRLETVYKDTDGKLKKWHLWIKEPRYSIKVKKIVPVVTIVEDNVPVNGNSDTYLKYTIRGLDPRNTGIWNDVRPDKVRAYISYFTKGIDKRILFNEARETGDGSEYLPGPKMILNCGEILSKYSPQIITKFDLRKYHHLEISSPFELAPEYHPNYDDITHKDTAEGCVKLSKHLGPEREILADEAGNPIGHVYIAGHVGHSEVLRPYLTKHNTKKDYSGLFLMAHGVPVLLQNTGTKETKPWNDGTFNKFQIFAECPQLTTQEGRKGFVENTTYNACLNVIKKHIRKWENTNWYKELGRAKATAKPNKKPKKVSDKEKEEAPLAITEEFRIYENPRIIINDLIESEKNIKEFHEYEPSCEKMLEALAYRLCNEWPEFRYDIIDMRAMGQDIIAKDRLTGKEVVGEAKLNLRDILTRRRNHQLRACHFILVWKDETLSTNNVNFDDNWLYHRNEQAIKHIHTNEEIPVVVLPHEISKYLKSKKS